jgi:hypothetical protein
MKLAYITQPAKENIEVMEDSLRSLLSPKMDALLSLLIAVGGGLVIAMENWLWSPLWSLVFLFIVVVFDMITAIDLQIKLGDTFRTSKVLKTVVDFLFLLGFLGILHSMPKVNAIFGAPQADPFLKLFPPAIYIYVLLNQLASAAKNAALAGRLKPPVSDFVIKYIDRHKDFMVANMKKKLEG